MTCPHICCPMESGAPHSHMTLPVECYDCNVIKGSVWCSEAFATLKALAESMPFDSGTGECALCDSDHYREPLQEGEQPWQRCYGQAHEADCAWIRSHALTNTPLPRAHIVKEPT